MKNNKFKILHLTIVFIVIVALFYYWFEFITNLYYFINILSNYLKDYLESNELLVNDNLINNDSLINDNLINNSLNNQIIENMNNSNNITSDNITPFYKTKSFIIISGVVLIIGLICIYTIKFSSGDVINNIEINNIQNINNINNSKLIDMLSNIISQKDNQINSLILENEQLLEQNVKVLKEAIQLTQEGREFIRSNNEHLLWILEG